MDGSSGWMAGGRGRWVNGESGWEGRRVRKVRGREEGRGMGTVVEKIGRGVEGLEGKGAGEVMETGVQCGR